MPPNKARQVVAEQRRTLVLQLKIGGATDRAIAEQVGVSLTQVHHDLHRRLHETRSLDKEAAEQIWRLQNARYERLLMRWWPVAMGNTEDAALATDKVLAALGRIDRISGILPEKPTYNVFQDNRSLTFRVVYDDDGTPRAIEASAPSPNGATAPSGQTEDWASGPTER